MVLGDWEESSLPYYIETKKVDYESKDDLMIEEFSD